MVASPGIYETASKGIDPGGLALFLGGGRFTAKALDALVKAQAGGQRAFHVRVHVEILGEVEAAVVPRKDVQR